LDLEDLVFLGPRVAQQGPEVQLVQEVHHFLCFLFVLQVLDSLVFLVVQGDPPALLLLHFPLCQVNQMVLEVLVFQVHPKRKSLDYFIA
jgi:hypothetical protein